MEAISQLPAATGFGGDGEGGAGFERASAARKTKADLGPLEVQQDAWIGAAVACRGADCGNARRTLLGRPVGGVQPENIDTASKSWVSIRGESVGGPSVATILMFGMRASWRFGGEG